MNNFWNERYSLEEYVYGVEPNQYFKTELSKLSSGHLLLPAEGEGRNAVFAAKLGWQVVAYDSSSEAKKKAQLLASTNNVNFEYIISDHESFERSLLFDCVALIFSHVPPLYRETFHKKITKYLKPGGIIILEGFAKEQINMESGGPKALEMLFSEDELTNDFLELTEVKIQKRERYLQEGSFHNGLAHVIQLVGKK